MQFCIHALDPRTFQRIQEVNPNANGFEPTRDRPILKPIVLTLKVFGVDANNHPFSKIPQRTSRELFMSAETFWAWAFDNVPSFF